MRFLAASAAVALFAAAAPAQEVAAPPPAPPPEHVGAFSSAGLAGALALLVGLVVLALGLVTAARSGPRRHAWALLVASALPIPITFVGVLLGMRSAYDYVTALGPAVTPRDLAEAHGAVWATAAFGALSVLLGLIGSVIALARSRPDAAD